MGGEGLQPELSEQHADALLPLADKLSAALNDDSVPRILIEQSAPGALPRFE